MIVQSGLCWNWSETPKTGFLTTRLKCFPGIQEENIFSNDGVINLLSMHGFQLIPAYQYRVGSMALVTPVVHLTSANA